MRRCLWSLAIVGLGVLLLMWRVRERPDVAPHERPDAAFQSQRPSHAAYRHDDGRRPPVNGAISTRALAKEPASLPAK